MIQVIVNSDAEAKLTGLDSRVPVLRKKLLGQIGWRMVRMFTDNLTAGKDANGKPLKPIQMWTRAASISRGKSLSMFGMIPLVNTGQMRNSMTVLEHTDRAVVVGFPGGQARKAKAQQEGMPGRMRVSRRRVPGWSSGVKTAPDGHEYIRVKSNDGAWFTKQVIGGTVSVKPAARVFFFLGPAQVKEVERLCREASAA